MTLIFSCYLCHASCLCSGSFQTGLQVRVCQISGIPGGGKGMVHTCCSGLAISLSVRFPHSTIHAVSLFFMVKVYLLWTELKMYAQ